MKPKIIIFSTATCRACKPYIASVKDAIAKADLTNEVDVLVADPASDTEFGSEVASVPMTLIKQGKRIIASFAGVTPAFKIIDEIERLLDEDED